jgi:hypothetical protein
MWISELLHLDLVHFNLNILTGRFSMKLRDLQHLFDVAILIPSFPSRLKHYRHPRFSLVPMTYILRTIATDMTN